MQKAIFASGCFWGVQYYFDQIPGVIETKVGYTGGHTENPTYELVCTRTTGHAEAVEITFDEEIIPFETLVKHFFHMHNPTQLNRQGPDVGDQYRSAIFYFNDEQHIMAERVKLEIQPNYEKEIVTQLAPATTFYEAEDYHQKYSERTGHGMCHVDYKDI